MIVRPCLCVPTYNNSETISDVVADCLVKYDLSLLVVDDGSDVQVEKLLSDDQIEDERLTVIRNSQNKGKGYSLALAFEWAVANGFTHLVAIDGDGQHPVGEAQKLIDKSVERPWDLIIGQRKFDTENVPAISKFGRVFSNYWVKYQTDSSVKDSQSGMRSYPLFHVQNLRFFTKKYDFEIEVLIRLIWKGVEVTEVPVEVIYQEEDKRVSHFHKFKDNARITALNIVFIVLALMKSKTSPFKSSVALGVGVFVGCSPLWGVHTLLLMPISFFAKLNFPLLWVGSQVSAPPMIPFLVFASIWLGDLVMGTRFIEVFDQSITLDQLKNIGGDQLLAFVVGTALLGLLAGGAVFAFSFLGLKLRQARVQQRNWTGKMRGGKWGNLLLVWILKTFGLKFGYSLLVFIVPYFYVFAPKARRGLIEYWRVRHPEVNYFKVRIRVLKHLFHFATVLMDRVYQSHSGTTKFEVSENGIENIVDPIKQRKGVLILGAHVGAWDIALKYLKDHDPEADVLSVQFSAVGHSFSKVKKEDEKLKELSSNRDHFAMDLHGSLAKGLPVGIMCDRPSRENCELLLFKGKLIPIDLSAFRIAVAARVPTVISFGFKSGYMRYDFYSTSDLQLRYGDGERNLKLLAWGQEYLDLLSSKLDEYPFSWFNFYTVFSSVPDAASSKPRRIKSSLLSLAPKREKKKFAWELAPRKHDGTPSL